MNKTTEEYFRDWHNNAVGYGYGSGEPHTIPVLKKFLELCNGGSYNHQYDYAILEKELTPTVTWLLISILCAHEVDILEYGTSSRFAWLTKKGERLKEFVKSKTDDELIEIVCSSTENSTNCYPNACNCGDEGYVKDKTCQNPFWIDDYAQSVTVALCSPKSAD